MKTKNLAVLLLGCIVAGMLTAFMISIHGVLPDIAFKVLITLLVLLAALALWLLSWLGKGIFQHFHAMHTAVLAGQSQRLELQEKRERWNLEKKEREARIQMMLSRVQPGTYILRQENGYLPGAGDVILLPGSHRAAGQIGGPGAAGQEFTQGAGDDDLPTEVAYTEIRHLIPRGHILVGVGPQGRIDTKDKAVGACTWIVGLSGTGKTSTTVLRIEERAVNNHAFIGVDPHWFKDDSLFHAVYETPEGGPGPYKNRFALPMAKTPEESLHILKTFLTEFQARKSGQRPKPWRPVTLLVDEVGALMDKATATTPEEKEIIELLPSIARICGQEARNFEMGGIFISQQATGLAWLRKVALMVIVHQLLQESEKRLATNEDTAVMQAMKFWPIGRTYVYGVGFGSEGPRTVQQPYFKPGQAQEPAARYEDIEGQNEMEALQPPEQDTEEIATTPELTAAIEAWNEGATSVRKLQDALGTTHHQAYKLYQQVMELIEAE